MPLCTPRPLKPSEVHVLYALERQTYATRSGLAAAAGVADGPAIVRVVNSLKTMKVVGFDENCNYSLTLRGKCALAERMHSCCQPRHRLITRGVLKNAMVSDQPAAYEKTGEEWVDEPCNAPLFSDADRARGICKGCLAKWEHEHSTLIQFNDGGKEIVADASEVTEIEGQES